MYWNFVCLEEITEITCVCKANSFCCNEVILHFNDCRLLALEIKLVCDFTTCKTAADDCDIFSDFFCSEKEVNGFDCIFYAFHRDSLCFCTCCNDDFVSSE